MERLTEIWDELTSTLESQWKLNEWDEAALVIERSDPMPESAQGEVAERLGVPLTDDLRAYLSFCNGLRLEWTVPDIAPRFGGHLHIPALETVAEVGARPSPIDLNAQWPDDQRPDWAKGVDLVPFDFYKRHSDNIEVAFFVPREGALDVAVTTDDTATIGESRLLSFGEYLQYVLLYAAAPDARTALTLGGRNRDGMRAKLDYLGSQPVMHPGQILDLMEDEGLLIEVIRG